MFYTWFLLVDFASKVIKKTALGFKIAFVILIFQKQTFDVSVRTDSIYLIFQKSAGKNNF